MSGKGKAMENEHKLAVLARIARQFNRAGITWAIGGSMLLYFKGITDEFQDIDIMLKTEDAETAKAILAGMGTLEPPKPSTQYKTKVFLEYTIDGVDVDILAGYVIVSNGAEHDCPLLETDIEGAVLVNHENVPLQSVKVWRRYYTLMGKAEKVRLIDAAHMRSHSQ